MKLTRRQIAFIEKMLDIYKETQGPFHYSLVAERLELSKYTAYDMLRLLEEKGYVESTYETHQAGPGRASVMFQPTQKARETFEQLAGEGDLTSWDQAKDRVITRIATGEFEDAELAQEILLQIEGGMDDVLYCSKVIGDLVNRFRARGRHRMMDYYASVILALIERRSARDLRLLPGFLMGLAANEDDAAELTETFLGQIRKYEILLDRMDKEGRKRLGDLLTGIFGPLQKSE